MNRTFAFKGFCPEQNKDYAISVDYLEVSTLSESKLVRGLAKCNYATSHNCSHIDDCPVLKLAPKER